MTACVIADTWRVTRSYIEWGGESRRATLKLHQAVGSDDRGRSREIAGDRLLLRRRRRALHTDNGPIGGRRRLIVIVAVLAVL